MHAVCIICIYRILGFMILLILICMGILILYRLLWVFILIILVMLIGTQAKMVWEELRTEKDVENVEIKDIESGISTAEMSVARLKSENSELEQAIADQKQAVRAAKKGRDKVQLTIEAMKTTIDQKKKELTNAEQKSRNLASVAQRLHKDLDSVQDQVKRLDQVKPETGVIEHLPTPIAKTVFGEEGRLGRGVHVGRSGGFGVCG